MTPFVMQAAMRKRKRKEPFASSAVVAAARQTQAETDLSPANKLFQDLVRNRADANLGTTDEGTGFADMRGPTLFPGATWSTPEPEPSEAAQVARRGVGGLQTLGLDAKDARQAMGAESVTERRQRTPGTLESVMRSIDSDPAYRGMDPETRSLIDSALTIRGYHYDPTAPFVARTKRVAPDAPAGRRITLKNEDVTDVLQSVRTPGGRAALKAEVLGFRKTRDELSQAAHLDLARYDQAGFTPEALHDAEFNGTSAVRGKDGSVIPLKDALQQANELGWGKAPVNPITEDQQAEELAPTNKGLGTSWIQNGKDIRSYLESRFGHASEVGSKQISGLLSYGFPALAGTPQGEAAFNLIGGLTGGLPAGWVQAAPMAFSNFDYALKTDNPPVDRAMAALEGLINVEFATGVPIMGHLAGKAWGKIKDAREVAALANDLGVEKDAIRQALNRMNDTRGDLAARQPNRQEPLARPQDIPGEVAQSEISLPHDATAMPASDAVDLHGMGGNDRAAVDGGRADAIDGGDGTGGDAGGGRTEVRGIEDLRRGLIEHFGVPVDQADAVARLTEARARTHARNYGGTPDDFVASRIAEVRSGDAAGLAAREGKALPQGAKGAAEPLADGRTIIHALTNPDVSTAIHELAHVFQRDLDAADQAIVGQEHARYLQQHQATHGTLDGAHEDAREFFARSYERWVAEGKTPHAPLRAVFEKFKGWMRDIYGSLKGTSIEAKLSKPMRDLLDRMHDEEGALAAKAERKRVTSFDGKAHDLTPEQVKAHRELALEFRDRQAELQADLANAETPDEKADIEFELHKLEVNFNADRAMLFRSTSFQDEGMAKRAIMVRATEPWQEQLARENGGQEIGNGFFSFPDTVETRYIVNHSGLEKFVTNDRPKSGKAADDGGLFGNEVLDQGSLFQDSERRLKPIEFSEQKPEDIRNPIDQTANDAEKLRQTAELTAENKPKLEAIGREIAESTGARSSVNVKQDDAILNKANRPSILVKKPWHGVEHVRDTLRFKTVANKLTDIAEAVKIFGKHAEVVKFDDSKLFDPDTWGWRMVAVDARMPNGQMVEWYAPFEHVEAAKKSANHELFEKWRGKTQAEIDANLPEYSNDVRESWDSYKAAFDADLKMMGYDDEAQAFADWMRLRDSVVGETPRQSSSSGMMKGAGANEPSGLAVSQERSFGASGSMTRTSPVESDLKTTPSDIGPENTTTFQTAESRDPFYHKSERVIEEKMSGPMAGEQLHKMLLNNGVKADEMRWTGLDDWLKGQQRRVTPEQVRAFLDENRVEVRDVVKGGGETPELTAAIERQREVQAAIPLEVQNEYLATRGDDSVGEWLAKTHPDLAKPYNDAIAETKRLAVKVTRYAEHTVPGGENYREVLLTTPGKPKPEIQAAREYYEHFVRKGGEPGWPGLTEGRQQEIAASMPDVARNAPDPYTLYKSPHWDEPNVLAHVRLSDRTIDGKRTLFVEEVQSDWHQAGREKGYQGETKAVIEHLPDEDAQYPWVVKMGGEVVGRMKSEASAKETAAGIEGRWKSGGVPQGPFAKTWPELAMKRVIRMASEEGYDAIAFTKGDTQALRYNQMLQEGVGRVMVTPRERSGGQGLGAGEKQFDFLATAKDGRPIVDDVVDSARLREMLGAKMHGEAMAAIEGGAPDWAATGDQIKIGGHGMREFYDNILPATVDKLGKKFGAKVGEATMGAGEPSPPAPSPVTGEGVPVHMMDITPEMRKSVMEDGQVLFQEGDPPKGYRTYNGRVTIAEQKQNPEWNRVKHNVFQRAMVAIAGDPRARLRNVGTAGSRARAAGVELADGLEKVIQFSTAHTIELSRLLESEISKQYGKQWYMSKTDKAELNDITTLIHEGKIDEMNDRQKAVHKVWVDIQRSLRPEADAVGVWVDDHVRGDVWKKLKGQFVSFYGIDKFGTRREMQGTVMGGGDDLIHVKVGGRGGGKFTLQKWDPYSRLSLVTDELFIPRVVKPEVNEAIQGLFNGDMTRKQEKLAREIVAEVQEQLGTWDYDSTVAMMRHIMDPQRESNTVVGKFSRIEKPRLPFKLPTEMYVDDFYKLTQNHIGGTVKRITAARIWGQDEARVQDLLKRISSGMGSKETDLLSDQIRYALGTHKSAEAEDALRTLASVEGAWQTTTKLTGIGTTIKQVSQTSAAYGVLGGKAWTQALGVVAHDLASGRAEIAAIRNSGAVTNDIRQMMGVDNLPKMMHFFGDIGITMTGVKATDVGLRYHAAIAGRIAVEDAVRGLKIERTRDAGGAAVTTVDRVGDKSKSGGGVIQRNAQYRLLRDWFGYEDSDIVRMAGSGLNKQDRVMAYTGGVKTQLMSRNLDMPKWMHDNPMAKVLTRFQTFNYQQAKLLGFVAKEAAAGNITPMARTIAGYAVTGYLTTEAVKRALGWMESKMTMDEAKRRAHELTGIPAPDMTHEEMAGMLVADMLKSGMLGMYGKPMEDVLQRSEKDPEFDWMDLMKASGNAIEGLISVPLLRDAGSLFKSGAYAAKTGGGAPAWIDEFLREAIVPYKRLAMRNDPDYAGIRAMRAEAKASLEAIGIDDTSIENWLNVKMPTPAPRGARQEFVDYKAKVAEKATKTGQYDMAREQVERKSGGRAPRTFESDAEKPPVKHGRHKVGAKTLDIMIGKRLGR